MAQLKRSEINRWIDETLKFLEEHHCYLPPFAFWTPQEWATRGHEADEIRQNGLGWDVTDFGSGDFHREGLLLFTIRNGNIQVPEGKTYCEKLLIIEEEQVTPMHFHWAKNEDIIVRAGGNLMIELYNSTPDEQLDDRTPVRVSTDGVVRELAPGTILTLGPGESITLPRGLYHKFWGEPGSGKVLGGEVSAVNDDAHDNRFLNDLPRFPGSAEDEPPRYLLCNEYPVAS